MTVFDSTAQASMTFDVGLNLSTFNGSSNYVFSLASDPEWQAFIAAIPAADLTNGNVSYEVVGANYPSQTASSIDMTTNSSSTGSVTNQMVKGVSAMNPYYSAANVQSTNSTSTSLFATKSGSPATYTGSGGGLTLGTIGATVAPSDLLGTAIKFFDFAISGTGNNFSKATVTLFSGSWLLDSQGNLTYNGSAGAVPLPPSVVLLLSGGILMALLGRRRLTVTPGSAMAAA
ncbi:MAG: hypothetical protein JOZ67_12485 [Gammaproteobacteria bacterium]|nr:hypothetical protein [Gammaproteobacteria bacterium]